MKNLIGISGKISSGKDTVGKIVQYVLLLDRLQLPHTNTRWIAFSTENRLKDETSFWEVKKFAGKLKQITAMIIGCTIDDLESEEFKNTPLGKQWLKAMPKQDNRPSSAPTYQALTPRKVLQLFGTEGGRKVVHEDIWVNALFSDYEKASQWVITDMRFPNELAMVQQHGGLTIRVERPGIDRSSGTKHSHASEKALDNSPMDVILINDGTIEDLIYSVQKILILYKFI